MSGGDAHANQLDEKKRIGDGQRGQDQHHEYPKMLFSGESHAVAADLDAELALIDQGYAPAASAANPLLDEVASLRAQLAAAQGIEPKRGPGRPRLTE